MNLGFLVNMLACDISWEKKLDMNFWFPGCIKYKLDNTGCPRKVTFPNFRLILVNRYPRKRPPIFSPKTAKNAYFWKSWLLGPKIPPKYLQKYPILAVFGPSCRPGWIFMVQNGWYRYPTYSTMFHVRLAPLGGLLGPNSQLFQK